jgi:hypothetical protein
MRRGCEREIARLSGEERLREREIARLGKYLVRRFEVATANCERKKMRACLFSLRYV